MWLRHYCWWYFKLVQFFGKATCQSGTRITNTELLWNSFHFQESAYGNKTAQVVNNKNDDDENDDH